MWTAEFYRFLQFVESMIFYILRRTVKHVPHSSDSNPSKDRENSVASQPKPHTVTGPNVGHGYMPGHTRPESEKSSRLRAFDTT